MKVVYVHQYFVTPDEPGGTRSYWISRELVSRGHEVVMITSTDGKRHKAGREVIDGINVEYILNPYSNYFSPIKKVWIFAKFIFQSVKAAMKEKDVDMVYSTSTPLTVGAVALALKFFKGWHYVFEVRDLWPEFPIQIGAIKNKVIIWLLRKFEKSIYKHAEHVVALSPGMQDGVVAAGTPIEKTTMVPNMSKPDLFHPHDANLEVAESFKIDLNKFNVIHFGSMGRANGLEYIINAANELMKRGCSDINFIFLGEGATQPILEKMVAEYGLTNVQFLGNHKMATVVEITNLCDASITSFKNLPILKTNSPNKLFDSLSAGKPIIVNSAGWTKDMVEKENCGFYVNPDDPADLAIKLLDVRDKKELLAEWGRNARALSENVYDKSKLSAQVADVIEVANAHKK